MKALYVLGGIAAIGAASVLYYHFTSPSDAALTKRDLPGFSISLPSGDEESSLRYRDGHVTIRDVAHSGGTLKVHWEAGGAFADRDIATLSSVLLKMADGGEITASNRTTGPHGESIVTITAKSDKGTLTMTSSTCGARRIILMTAGDRMEDLHRRVFASLDCHPDPKSDAALGDLPWVFEPPDGWKVHKAPAGRAEFTDGHSQVLVRGLDKMPSHDDLRQLLQPVLSAGGMDATLGDWHGDRLALHVTHDGVEKAGFAMPVDCPRGAVMVLVLSNDDAAADAAHEVLVAHGHCATSDVLMEH